MSQMLQDFHVYLYKFESCDCGTVHVMDTVIKGVKSLMGLGRDTTCVWGYLCVSGSVESHLG